MKDRSPSNRKVKDLGNKSLKLLLITSREEEKIMYPCKNMLLFITQVERGRES